MFSHQKVFFKLHFVLRIFLYILLNADILNCCLQIEFLFSETCQHIQEDSEVVDFELTDEGMQQIKAPFFTGFSCYVGITSAEGFYLRIIESRFINIGTSSFGCLRCHDLRNEFLLVFKHLIEV